MPTELKINKGVPQGSILAPVLFSLYINDMGQEIKTAKIHLYADDTIIYTVAQSMNHAIELLQDSFRSLQFSLIKLKLVLNANKTKNMFFTRCRTKITVPPILTLEGDYIERVNSYKYLGIWLDERLGFNIHIENLLKKLRPKLGFLFRIKKCFPFEAKKRIIQSCFLSVLNYGDVVYMHANLSLLKKLDSIYHAAIRFVTNTSSRSHQNGWMVLLVPKEKNAHTTIYCQCITR